MKAVFLDRGSFPKHIDITLPAYIDEYVEYDNTTTPEQVIERIKDADIVMVNKAILNAESLHHAKSVKFIQVMATGTNNVDLDACEAMSIKVSNVAGYSGISVPEHTFAMLLALRRNLIHYLEDIKAGKWAEAEYFCFIDHPIKDLSGSTIALIGGGALGQKVATIARAFGMEVLFVERKQAQTVRSGYVSFHDAIQQADIVSLHCPLNADTENLIGQAEFSMMKPSCLLLNMSRGGLVDESALVNALKGGHIAGAAFDVATQEPMPLNHPLQTLTHCPNFLLTPHIAWASDEAMQTLIDIAIDKIAAFASAGQADTQP
ncbi:D-2-hydroxyacid dehydrogenase [Marinomonas algarum]|uniref:D-2-hydroxyacid dehydrogenase n=1 Tax=Marinomonas algarum TaxID=2883105 RepID=A0A9X1LER8_9GAMM|nr:D-2-hydroxyacid dehydrogenase [Marinomonas algarum]MCB5161921.1 D-2-hydroxyacid dehydrogenase [Marinomonas algarum]